MDQQTEERNEFPGNIIELTDSLLDEQDIITERKPPDYFSEKTLRKRKCSFEKELCEQLSEDYTYQNCIGNVTLFLKHLKEKGISNIYQYLKYCNKKGILLEDEILKKNNIKPIKANYNVHQCKIIHNKNSDYKNLETLLTNIKSLKKTLKFDDKIKKNLNIEYYNFEEVTLICQTKQHRYLAPNIINTILYDVSPLDQGISLETINYSWIQYMKFYENCVQEYKKQNLRDQCILSDDDETNTNEIVYDQISSDSLAPYCEIVPSKRPPQYRSMSLSVSIQSLKIVQINTFTL